MYFISDGKKQVIVSGSHPVLEDGVWIRAENHSSAVPMPKPYQKKYIYSLHTSKSRIYTHLNGMVFGDYDEITDARDNYTIFRNQIEHLNSNHVPQKFQFKDYGQYYYSTVSNSNFKPYFDPLTPITILNGNTDKKIYIKDVKIGDVLLNGGRILGISKLLTDSTTVVYQVDLKVTDLLPIYCTVGSIIKNIKDNTWNPVSDNIFSRPYPDYCQPIMYSLLTESGTISINHLIFQDHDNNYHLQNEVDKFTLQQLNC